MSNTVLLNAFDDQALEQGCLTEPQRPQAQSADTGAPVRAGAEVATTSYVMDETGLIYMKPTRDGETPVRLTNFTATIKSQVVRDDGAETSRLFEIEARLDECVRVFTVASNQFGNLNWATEHMGARAVIYPGTTLKDHARTAIQLLSRIPEELRIFTHTGWRKTDKGWMYLHGGGAIGESGCIAGVKVDLSPPLDIFELPDPPDRDTLAKSIRASLGLLDVAPDRVSVPLLAALYRSVLGPADFSVHLAGPSGAGKSELAALLQQHFGPGFSAKRLPASWSSTANSLELLTFSAKDALLVVDDFAPGGSQQDVQRMHRDADRLFRAQGNRSGRQRARPDGSLRPVKGPRGLVVSTGEDVPRTYSVRARIFIVDVTPQDMDWGCLSNLQKQAADGVLASAMAGYVKWLSGRYAEIRRRLSDAIATLRERAAVSGGHKRTPDIVANLAHGFSTFLDFAVDVGAVTTEEREALHDRMWRALGQVSEAQCDHHASAEPAQRFIELLRTALTSGQAHVAALEGGNPAHYECWGWRERISCLGDDKRSSEIQPQGSLVGWTDGVDLYIDASAAYKAIQGVAAATGDSMGISPKTLTKRLREQEFLASIDEARGRLTVRRTLQGSRRDVLHLKAEAVVDVVQSATAKPLPVTGTVRPAAGASDCVRSKATDVRDWLKKVSVPE
jgi:hypothetical protein